MSITTEDIAFDLDNCCCPMDLGELFGRDVPVQIEVGSGKGTFLLNQARAYPDVNFLGIEWASKYYRHSVDRIRRWQMQNVRITRADARELIGRFLPSDSVDAFHIYYPDPWPKKRHYKRRFFTKENLFHVARCLKTGGRLMAATDHAEYFEVISDVVSRHGIAAGFFEQVDFQPASTANPGEWVGSNFERKYQKEGRETYTIAVMKV